MANEPKNDTKTDTKPVKTDDRTPVVGKNGEYKKATYLTKNGNVRVDN